MPYGSDADERLTNSQVNRAGRVMRHARDPGVSPKRVDQALRVIERFRAAHA